MCEFCPADGGECGVCGESQRRESRRRLCLCVVIGLTAVAVVLSVLFAAMPSPAR